MTDIKRQWILAVALALELLSGTPAVAAEVYRWVDEKGNQQFSSVPPPTDQTGVTAADRVKVAPPKGRVSYRELELRAEDRCAAAEQSLRIHLKALVALQKNPPAGHPGAADWRAVPIDHYLEKIGGGLCVTAYLDQQAFRTQVNCLAPLSASNRPEEAFACLIDK